MLKTVKTVITDIKDNPLIGVAILVLIGMLVYTGYVWTLDGKPTFIQIIVLAFSFLAFIAACILTVVWAAFYVFRYVKELVDARGWTHEED